MAAPAGLPSPDEPLPHTEGMPWRIWPGTSSRDIQIRDSLEMLPAACPRSKRREHVDAEASPVLDSPHAPVPLPGPCRPPS
eukprot:14616316-Heterocapsa_arctica.AAC.1